MPKPKPKIGIALGSGGARGWIHVGVLQALKDEGFEPDIVAGCSMGALVGAAFAAGWLDELEEWAVTITRSDIVRLLDISLLNGGLIDGSRVMEFLRGFKGDALIEDLEKPYMAIASNLTTGREVWLREGSIFDAVRASVSIPGFLRPYNLDGKWLVDGGLTNPVPVSACHALGADFIIAVNPNADILKYVQEGNDKKTKPDPSEGPHTELMRRMLDTVPVAVKERIKAMTPGFLTANTKPMGYMTVLSSSIDIMTDQIMRSRLAGEPPHIMLDPQLGPFGTIEFNRAAEAIAEGRRIVQEALPFLYRRLG
ncbi:patatin-like phospholipase family protein [Profundibacter sp.]|uniref:patatin-like phospholipase family protein n=1 Tax=Profundibacter sp. TaxID=3101071 RepID=UPI003D0A47A7